MGTLPFVFRIDEALSPYLTIGTAGSAGTPMFVCDGFSRRQSWRTSAFAVGAIQITLQPEDRFWDSPGIVGEYSNLAAFDL
jgi:hypothetical protein